MALIAHLDLELQQMDGKTTFFNGNFLKKLIYLCQKLLK